MPLGSAFSRPKKLVRLASSELVRVRDVLLDSLAVSATETLTVMTSPTWLARGSWKKLLRARLPQRIAGMADRRQLRECAATICGVGGISHRRQLRGLADSLDAVHARSSRTRRVPKSGRAEILERLRMANPICGRWRWDGSGEAARWPDRAGRR